MMVPGLPTHGYRIGPDRKTLRARRRNAGTGLRDSVPGLWSPGPSVAERGERVAALPHLPGVWSQITAWLVPLSPLRLGSAELGRARLGRLCVLPRQQDEFHTVRSHPTSTAVVIFEQSGI